MNLEIYPHDNEQNSGHLYESADPKELSNLKWDMCTRYVEVANISQDKIAQWMNENGAAVDMIIDNDLEFARAFVSVQEPDVKKFEELLKQYPR